MDANFIRGDMGGRLLGFGVSGVDGDNARIGSDGYYRGKLPAGPHMSTFLDIICLL
jgi:hypothetical protein